jgi:hypothetical protein
MTRLGAHQCLVEICVRLMQPVGGTVHDGILAGLRGTQLALT